MESGARLCCFYSELRTSRLCVGRSQRHRESSRAARVRHVLQVRSDREPPRDLNVVVDFGNAFVPLNADRTRSHCVAVLLISG